MIHCLVVLNGTELEFSAIYGMHTIEGKNGLWEAIDTLSSMVKRPWLVMGDFNAILKGEDGIGKQVLDSETRDFEQCLITNGITEMRESGRTYTWTNSHVHSKIDRVVIIYGKSNDVRWMYRSSTQFSDHCTLCVNIENHQWGGTRPFKFFNH